MEKWPIGVFASIDAGLGVKLEVAHDLGIPTIQLHAPSPENRTPEKARQFLARLADYNLRLTAVFGGFAEEDYTNTTTVLHTVGLVPPALRAARLVEMREIADFAKALDCPVVALHLGFVPHDRTSADYLDVVSVTQQLCDHCAANGQNLHLETGQETAEALVQFIGDVARPNLFVNFDPANMILYGTGEPIAALRAVSKYVRSVHCKDGTWEKMPDSDWGAEVPLGEGDVGMENYLRTLLEIGYDGPLTIEREIPQEPARQKAEIAHAAGLLTELKQKLGVA